jgi:mannose/cellobiose epimerase-like protein (N-acyl-D-glucosamine 2-epimerase family)
MEPPLPVPDTGTAERLLEAPMSVRRPVRGGLFGAVACLSVATLLALPAAAPASTTGALTARGTAAGPVDVPEVLSGDRWLRHHREDLMPYWDMPEALGEPVGNFPSFRGRNGELLPATGNNPNRGLSTLARGVYGYSLAFMLTGEERYLTYARAGIDWIDAKAKDPVHGGYFGLLDASGQPVNPLANKEVFDLASLGLAYGMYFNVTRDPAVEAELLAVRDLLFEKYYDPVGNRVMDALTYDLATEVDPGNNGGDITDLLVPGTALLLPYLELLSDPGRRTQFRDDLRRVTDILITRHKDSESATNPWWFWGRTLRFGSFGANLTDFGHNIKSYEMIHNANQVFPDRPWTSLAADREVLMTRAWDSAASRWNERLRSLLPGAVERDSAWWVHAEADQTLAALDLTNGFAHQTQLATSAQSFLDVFVDDESPARETFARISRVAADTDLRKSFFGKNMLHAHEHALIMYLHGRALEGRPARLYYAFPEDQALSAVAKPYWFDAAGQTRTVADPLATLPGRRLVEVDFTGLDAVLPPPFPAPDDTTAPTTVATVSPDAGPTGWHNADVAVSLLAADDVDGVGVEEIHARVTERDGLVRATAVIDPGEELTLPALGVEGEHDVTFFAVDRLGNREVPRTLTVRIDRTAPGVTGLPEQPCVIWPPNEKLVRVADVVGTDNRSGVASLQLSGTSSEPAAPDDIVIVGNTVYLRATRDDEGPGRTYTVVATVTDQAGNATTRQSTCVVPHHVGQTASEDKP